MSILNKRKTIALAVVTATAAGLFAPSASAAPEGSVTMSPTTGTETTTFGMGLPAGASCSGPGTAGYFWTTYILPASANPETYTWTGGTPNAPSGEFGSAMFDGGGNPIDARGASAPSGQITGIPASYTLEFFAGNPLFTAGSYNIGYACTNGSSIDATHYWQTPITVSNVTATGFDWDYGAVPPAPASISAVAGNEEITGSFATVAATPATTAYQVTASPVGAGASVSVTVPAAAGATLSYTIPGLVNGAAYNVSVIATNSVGDSSPTTSADNPVTPSLPVVIPAPVVAVASGPSPVTVSWTPSTGTPLAGASLVSHTVTFTPVGTAAVIPPTTLLAGTNLTSVPGVAGDGYMVSVVGNYSNGQVTAPGLVAFSFTNAQVVVQDITVVRPAGALVLTQRCGVHGSAPVYTDTTFGTLTALTATAGADPIGSDAPTAIGTAPKGDDAPANPNSFGTNPVGPAGSPTAAGANDVLFNQYPYPVDGSGNSIATYATNCGIDLGTASLITSGPAAGQYFKATGRIAQLTVVDTRNTNAGWTLNGRMGNFSNGTDSFSGNLLGWVPEVTWDSNANLDGYDMDANPGGVRYPTSTSSTTGLGASFNSTNTSLANSLAKADAGLGLGMAVMDARINLLIPVSADAGTYKGVLTFTIV